MALSNRMDTADADGGCFQITASNIANGGAFDITKMAFDVSGNQNT